MKRQTILLEQGMLNVTMIAVTQPFTDGTFDHSEMLDRDRSPLQSNSKLRHVGQLCMRLVRHIFRNNAASKAGGMDHVSRPHSLC